MPQLMNVTQRTCLVCKPTAEQLEEQRRADLGLTDEEELPALEGAALPLPLPQASATAQPGTAGAAEQPVGAAGAGIVRPGDGRPAGHPTAGETQ